MSDVRVRPLRRGDRDQLAQLVNAHAEAVVPGMRASVNTVLGSLERRPGEFGGQSYDDYRAFLPAVGFRELTRTARGLTRSGNTPSFRG